MATEFASNKLFLDQAGVQALIKKIADIKKELESNLSGAVGDLTDLIELVGTIIEKGEEGTVAKGILADVIAAAEALRAELGDAPEEVTETVYEKLADLTSRIEDIEAKNLDDLDKAFVDVEQPVYDANAQKVTINFKNRKGEVAGTAKIDTKDFVVHGLMDGVDVVSYNGKDDQVTIGKGEDAVTLDVPFEVKAHAGKYIIFRFKLAHEHDDMENSAHDEMKAVWVNVNDLFTDYKFEGEVAEGSEGYIEVEAIEATPDYTDANKVTIKVGLGADQKAVNDLVEGKTQADGKPVGETYRGIVELNDDLEALESEFETHVGEAEDLKADVEQLQEEVEGEDGLIKKMETAEGKIEALETWTQEKTINVQFIDDYFNWAYEGTNPEPPKPENY